MTEITGDQDAVRKYTCDKAPNTRLTTVRLGQTKEEMLNHQKMPLLVKKLCEELVVGACLLAQMLKFEGDLILQTKGSGPLKMIVAECSSKGFIRATAQWDDLADCTDFAELIGEGYFAVTLDPIKGERYQGIVALEGHSIIECINHYFAQSEQLATRLWIASDGEAVGGLLIQNIPEEGGQARINDTDWIAVSTLADTMTAEELAQDAGPLLIYKLFHELSPRSFAPWKIAFGCSCSKERSSRALRALGEDEVKQLFSEQPELTVDCHFCGQVYQYDQADLEWLLSDQPPGSYILQ